MFRTVKEVEQRWWQFIEFLEPVKLRIRRPDGREELMGYGVGEKVCVLMEMGNLASINDIKRKEIPMKDGSVIIGWSEPEPRIRGLGVKNLTSIFA